MVRGLFHYALLIIALCIVHSLSLNFSNQRIKRFRPDASEKNVVRSRRKAEELLERYGYLKCKSPVQEGEELLLKLSIDFMGLKIFESPQGTCSEKEIQRAIKNFQITYNVDPSGELDDHTLQIMSKSRCGNSDEDQESNSYSTQNISDQFLSRRRRENLKLEKNARSEKKNSEIAHSLMIANRRRNQLFKEYLRKIGKSHKRRRAHRRRRVKENSRRRRIRSMEMKRVVTWRLMKTGYSSQLRKISQRAAMSLAFRMWSEVIPLTFVEDNSSPNHAIDIQIAFGRGEHLNCLNNFDGFGGQLGHAVKFQKTSKSQIHVDDDEHYTIGFSSGTNLVKVAVHEIGHALGLLHTSQSHSVMYAIYSKHVFHQDFELSTEDRSKVQNIYGVCGGSFDVVMDWISKSSSGAITFNTYFFRNDKYWLYHNKFNRTRYGDPFNIKEKWVGLPNKMDAFVHVWTRTKNKYYFFKGQYYWLYDAKLNRAKIGFPRKITDDFRSPKGAKKAQIPRKVDSVIFNPADGYLYFFRNNMVFAYDISKGRRGNIVQGYPKKLGSLFSNQDSNGSGLPQKLDSVYYSYSDSTIYFFKDMKYWKLAGSTYIKKNDVNIIAGPWNINTKWKDICDVE